jgi:hypothetical protein
VTARGGPMQAQAPSPIVDLQHTRNACSECTSVQQARRLLSTAFSEIALTSQTLAAGQRLTAGRFAVTKYHSIDT